MGYVTLGKSLRKDRGKRQPVKSGDDSAISQRSAAIRSVELLLPEHCCCYGGKLRWAGGPFWLFLAVENPAGPKKDFSYKKKWAYGGPRLCPHMPFFLRKNIFPTRLAFCMLRTAKKAAKGTRACLRSSSSALATVIQLSGSRRIAVRSRSRRRT